MTTLIQCRLGPIETQVGGQSYNFQMDREQRAVSIVENLVHVQCFLSVSHYIQVQPLPILAVQIPAAVPIDQTPQSQTPAPMTPEPAPIAPPAPGADAYTLLGSSILPNFIEIPHGQPVALGDIVARAFTESGVTIEVWNTLPNEYREGRLDGVVEALRADAERAHAAAEAVTADEAAAAAAIAAAAQAEADAAAKIISDAAEAEAAAEEAAAIERARIAKIPVIDPIIDIGGLGPVAQKKLAEIDVTSFAQIAGWDEPTILLMEEFLGMKGAITRGDWVGQAKQLQLAKEAADAADAAAAQQA